MGSQLELPGRARKRDGVVGVWYGKSPGVDRAGDALRHGNTLGAHPRGGVLVLAGDDPAAKSSTPPSASERTLAAYGLPVVYPRNSDELIAFGLYGIALSRASGCWVGVKVAADVADGLWRVNRSLTDLTVTVPVIEQDGRPWSHQQRTMAAPPASLLAEQELTGPRWEIVRAFAAANPANEIAVDPAQAWLGIAAPGKTYDDSMQALRDLGLDPDDVGRAGVRVLRVGMPYPLEPRVLHRFARGRRSSRRRRPAGASADPKAGQDRECRSLSRAPHRARNCRESSNIAARVHVCQMIVLHNTFVYTGGPVVT